MYSLKHSSICRADTLIDTLPRPIYISQRLRRFAKLNFGGNSAIATAMLDSLHAHLEDAIKKPHSITRISKLIKALADGLRNTSTDSDRAGEWYVRYRNAIYSRHFMQTLLKIIGTN